MSADRYLGPLEVFVSKILIIAVANARYLELGQCTGIRGCMEIHLSGNRCCRRRHSRACARFGRRHERGCSAHVPASVAPRQPSLDSRPAHPTECLQLLRALLTGAVWKRARGSENLNCQLSVSLICDDENDDDDDQLATKMKWGELVCLMRSTFDTHSLYRRAESNCISLKRGLHLGVCDKGGICHSIWRAVSWQGKAGQMNHIVTSYWSATERSDGTSSEARGPGTSATTTCTSAHPL